jgi:tRNA G18 (ribose-2'-O)-methylase SpoU
MPVVRVTEPGDPRIAEFLGLTDVAARTAREPAEGFFVAEGRATIERATQAGFAMRALVTTSRWLDDANALAGDSPVLLVADDVLEATTGYHVHRGVLASFERRPLPDLPEVLRDARTVVVLEDLNDHTNVGAVFRSVAALGVDAVLLTPRTADPLYRRAIRTSMGAVFSVPWTRIEWFEGPSLLRDAGFLVVGLTPAADAEPLPRFAAELAAGARVALVIGAEGPGLSERWLTQADARVRIPMRDGVDSLNAGAAAAVASYGLGLGRNDTARPAAAS